MKKILFLLIVALCYAPVLTYADDCSDALSEAKVLYNSGDYAKAKSLFEYVRDECNNYGNATYWIAKCNDALTPKLSLSRSNISLEATSGSTSITVTSNRTWVLKNTSSSMFSVSKSGNTITIQYYANSSTNSRDGYFDVETTDGSKSIRVYIYQKGKSISASLSVSKTSISAQANGTTEYITVDCNTSWEIPYPSGNMYNVTKNGNTLTVKIHANPSTQSRSDYFYIQTTDGNKKQKIELLQSGQVDQNLPTAKILKIWKNDNVSVDGKKGLKIHVHFEVNNMKNKTGNVVAYFYHKNGTDGLKDTNNKYHTTSGTVATSSAFTPSYDNSSYKDFTLFIPYSELHVNVSGTYKFYVAIWGTNDKVLVSSEMNSFTYTIPQSNTKTPSSTSSSTTSQQTTKSTKTIKGTVLNAVTGKPLVGAVVSDVGTSKATFTDYDGKFTLETKEGATLKVTYTDFETKLVYATNNLQIRLNPLKKSKSNKVLINTYLLANMGISMQERWSVGLTFGQLYNGYGWYLKGRTNFIFPKTVQGLTFDNFGYLYNDGELIFNDPFYSGETTISECVATVGFVMDFINRVKWRNENNMFGMYAGLGYGHSRLYWQLEGTKDWIMYTPGSITGVSVDCGLIASMGGFTLTAGINTINFKYLQIEAGIGWTF